MTYIKYNITYYWLRLNYFIKILEDLEKTEETEPEL